MTTEFFPSMHFVRHDHISTDRKAVHKDRVAVFAIFSASTIQLCRISARNAISVSSRAVKLFASPALGIDDFDIVKCFVYIRRKFNAPAISLPPDSRFRESALRQARIPRMSNSQIMAKLCGCQRKAIWNCHRQRFRVPGPCQQNSSSLFRRAFRESSSYLPSPDMDDASPTRD